MSMSSTYPNNLITTTNATHYVTQKQTQHPQEASHQMRLKGNSGVYVKLCYLVE